MTLTATVRAASTYRPGMCRAAATMTASTAISADWPMYRRMWSRSSAWRSIPNSASRMSTAMTFAPPVNTPGAWVGSAWLSGNWVRCISHPRGRA